MTDATWMLTFMGVSFVWTRLTKFWPSMPKDALPWVALAVGLVASVSASMWGGATIQDAMAESWRGLAGGLMAVGGHSALRPLLVTLVGDQMAVAILGRLPRPDENHAPE